LRKIQKDYSSIRVKVSYSMGQIILLWNKFLLKKGEYQPPTGIE